MVAFDMNTRFEAKPVDEDKYQLERELRDAQWRIHKLRGAVYIERRKRYSGNLFWFIVGGAVVWIGLMAFAARPF